MSSSTDTVVTNIHSCQHTQTLNWTLVYTQGGICFRAASWKPCWVPCWVHKQGKSRLCIGNPGSIVPLPHGLQLLHPKLLNNCLWPCCEAKAWGNPCIFIYSCWSICWTAIWFEHQPQLQGFGEAALSSPTVLVTCKFLEACDAVQHSDISVKISQLLRNLWCLRTLCFYHIVVLPHFSCCMPIFAQDSFSAWFSTRVPWTMIACGNP